ncbi:Ankyrin repeat-containing domain [Phytophthora cactorum]|nr:Ankyrin repeat-containing domain [Phytophthora cactorum]
MCDRLGRRHAPIAQGIATVSCQPRFGRRSDDRFDATLDCLQRDGSLDLTALPIGNRVVQTGRSDGEGVKAMCRKAAAVIKAKFTTPLLICTHQYFTFPARPDFVNQEYGTKSFKTRIDHQNREDVFCELMDLLEDTDGPLSDSEIRKDPELLNMLSLRSMTWTAPNAVNSHNLANAPRDDLSTLLHLVAAGPAHDADLVEWIIQMGALTLQPTLHCRIEPRQSSVSCSRDDLCRTMAVHSVAISGHEDIVRIILEADNMIDLNTPTFDTKETLAHLAVKHGHRSLYCTLAGLGPISASKIAVANASDRAWANDIANSTATLERSQARTEGAKNRDAQFRHEGSLRAERLRQSVSAQRDEERRRAFANASTNTVDGSKKKSKKKGKKGKKGKTKGSAPNLPAASPAAPKPTLRKCRCLPVLTSTQATNPRRLPCWKTRLRILQRCLLDCVTPTSPRTTKVDDAMRACTQIETLEQVVEMFSHPADFTLWIVNCVPWSLLKLNKSST